MPASYRPIHWPALAASVLLLSGCISNPGRDAPIDSPEKLSSAPARTVKPPPPEPPPPSQREAPPNVTAESELTRDLWEHIAGGYAIELEDHPRLQKELDWLREHPNYLLRASERAQPYLHYVVEAAEERGLPLELALLPIVESGFNPRARSPYDAAGLWQFIPPTAEAFGLKQTWWYDGRLDIAASTRAAFDYLERLSGQFDGDWTLALSAYNAGPAAVRRAIARNQAEGLSTDYWSLDLPSETRRYVPRLLAIARAVESPSDYGITLTPIADEPRLIQVELPRQIDLRLASELAGLETEQLLALNPGNRRWATDPEGPHELLLPAAKADRFGERLEALDDADWVSAQSHRIRSGDTLSGIARRYGVRVDEIQRLNRLQDSRIRIGGFLLIPNGEPEQTVAEPTADGPRYHRVRPGDTLWAIARQYQLDYRKLAAVNGLTADSTLRPGQQLRLNEEPKGRSDRTLSYKVRPGDSLYVIARRFGVDITDLKRWNRIDGSRLQPGQTLTLYLPLTTASRL